MTISGLNLKTGHYAPYVMLKKIVKGGELDDQVELDT